MLAEHGPYTPPSKVVTCVIAYVPISAKVLVAEDYSTGEVHSNRSLGQTYKQIVYTVQALVSIPNLHICSTCDTLNSEEELRLVRVSE